MKKLMCSNCGGFHIEKAKDKCEDCGSKGRLSEDQTFFIVDWWRCLTCGFTNSSYSEVCRNCTQVQIRYCTNCGDRFQPGFLFCAKCDNYRFSPYDTVNVVLISVSGKNQNAVSIILRAVKKKYDVDLRQIKSIAEDPSIIAKGVPIKEAIKLKANLELMGAVVEFTNIKPSYHGVRDH